MESILFKNVTLISDEGEYEGDVLVEAGKIAKIGPSLRPHAATIIDEPGLTLMPGVIDPHVHFRDPGATWKEDLRTGSMAAAAGGVTSFFDMPNTKPSTTTLAAMAAKKAMAAEKSLVNFNFFMGATPDNLDACVNVENVPGIKIYMGSSTGSLLVDNQEALEALFREVPHVIAVHAEDEDMIKANRGRLSHIKDVSAHNQIRNPEAALAATKRAIDLAERHRQRLHICHLTTAEEAAYIREKNSAYVTTEVSPQHLLLNTPDITDRIGCFAQINPPLREKRHSDALFDALVEGTIHFVATDHAPHTIDEKERPFGEAPSGMPGIETVLPIFLDLAHKEKISYQQVQHWLSTAPAQVYNIANKGRIATGYDADLTIVDRRKTYTIENAKQVTKAKWSAFDGRAVTGAVIATVVKGHIVYREGDFFDEIKGSEIPIVK